MEELDATIESERKELGKKQFDHKDVGDPPTAQLQQSESDPESEPLHKDGFYCSEHRTVDSKNNIIANVCVTPANVNDVDPIPDILDDIEKRQGRLSRYMGVDTGYRNAPTCHQIAYRGIQSVVGYCRQTHEGERFGK